MYLVSPSIRLLMRTARVYFSTTGILFLAAGGAVLQGGVSGWFVVDQSWFFLDQAAVLNWVEYLGILAIGWGVGVTGWLLAGHQALSCFFVNVPRAWILWQRQVLTSILPVCKYWFAGILFVGCGGILAQQLWGVWTGAYDIGLFTGGLLGAIHSVAQIRDVGSHIDFLEANQRYINPEKTSLFTEYKP